MKTEINNELIRTFNPCYDPKDVCVENETLSVVDWVAKYRNKLNKKEDVIWLLCRPEYMSDKDCRLFAVWCARDALKLIEKPDERSINACDVAERFANGLVTEDELSAARVAAWAAAWDAAESVAWAVAWAAAWATAEAAARSAAEAAARSDESQIDQLLTYF